MCFFFNDTATTEIYTLSLHDALPILLINIGADVTIEKSKEDAINYIESKIKEFEVALSQLVSQKEQISMRIDRKSTRLNSSHANISYAVFCLKKKKIIR